jgi:hypothetical protein
MHSANTSIDAKRVIVVVPRPAVFTMTPPFSPARPAQPHIGTLGVCAAVSNPPAR